MQRRASFHALIPALIAANVLITAFWGCSLIVDGNFIEPGDAGYNCTGITNGELCPGAETEAARLICLYGECVESRCGDGFIDEVIGEECEDRSNSCDEDTCRFVCWVDEDCEEPATCMGVTCIDHACVASVSPAGTRCYTEEVGFGACSATICGVVSCDDDEECVGETACESGVCEDGLCQPNIGGDCTLDGGGEGVCNAELRCEPELD